MSIRRSMTGSVLAVAVAFGIAATVHAATELAKVNGRVITLEDFNSKYKDSMRFFHFKAPTKKNVLEEMIERDLGIDEAKREGIENDPEVKERINTVLFQSLVDKKLSSKFNAIQVSNDEAKDYYKKNPEIRTSHIFVAVRFDATPAQEKLAFQKISGIKALLDKELRSGKKTFAEVARENSEGVAAAAGGDIDYQTKDKLDPIYYQAAVNLGVGDISGIVRSQYGYHIIKLTGKKSFDDVDPGMVRRLVFDQKRSAIYDQYMSELRSKAKVSVNYGLISASGASEKKNEE